MTNKKLQGHVWIDTSYHGSPTWVCKFCDVNRWDLNNPEERCPKFNRKMLGQAELYTQALRRDLEDLQRRKAYESYLLSNAHWLM